MATFEEKIESMTQITISSSNTVPTQAQVTEFLNEGIRDFTNKIIVLRPDEAFKFASESTDTDNSGVEVKGKVLSVTRQDGVEAYQNIVEHSSATLIGDKPYVSASTPIIRPATEIPAQLRYNVEDKTSLHYRSTTNPCFYRLNGKVYVVPRPYHSEQQAIVSQINYQTTVYNATSIGGTLKKETGISCTNADPSVFTSTSTSFADDDVVKLSDFSVTSLNGMSGLIVDDKTTHTFTLKGISVDVATGGTIETIISGFPDEYEDYIVIYASAKSCQAAAADIQNNMPTVPTAPIVSGFENIEDVSLPILPSYVPPDLNISLAQMQRYIGSEDTELVDKAESIVSKQFEFFKTDNEMITKQYDKDMEKFNSDLDNLGSNMDRKVQKATNEYRAKVYKYQYEISQYSQELQEKMTKYKWFLEQYIFFMNEYSQNMQLSLAPKKAPSQPTIQGPEQQTEEGGEAYGA